MPTTWTIYLIIGSIALPLIIIIIVLAVVKSMTGMNSDKGSDKGHPLVIGTILSIRDTGRGIGGSAVQVQGSTGPYNPICALTVGFMTREGRAVTAMGEALISLVMIPQFQPGCAVPLRYDPANPAKIRIVLDASPYELQQAQYR